MGLSAYLPILAAAGAGHARGKFNRQMIDREDMKDALLEHHRKTLEENERRRLDNQDRDRRDVLQFRMDDAAERAKDRDADREERRQTHREQSLDRGEARTARREARELRPDEREKGADDFAYRMVSAAGGDPRVAQDYGARDLATAKKLGLRRDHYYAAADRYKHRDVAKSKVTESDDELNGGAPAAAGAAPSTPALPPLSDVDRQKAETDPGFKDYLVRKGYKF